MLDPHWFDSLRRQLHARGLPANYIDRFVAELSDHSFDLTQENTSMDAHCPSVDSTDQLLTDKLGSPELLAATAQREFRRRTFAGRHPVATFLCAPLPAVILTIILPCLLLAGCNELIKGLAGTPGHQHQIIISPFWDALLLLSFVGFERIIPFVLCTWFFLSLARRAGRPVWGFAACGVIILFASCFKAWATPAVGSEQAQLFLGAGFSVRLSFWSEGLLQATLPAVLTLAAWLQLRRQHSPSAAVAQN